METIKVWILTLWVGGLWIIGALVAPTLFMLLPNNRALAGSLAGHLFGYIGWIGLVSGILLMGYWLLILGFRALQDKSFWVVVVILLLIGVSQFAIFPIVATLRHASLAGANQILGAGFATWHHVSSALYLLECLLGAYLVQREFRL